MSFLATAPDEGLPGQPAGTGLPECGPGPIGMASLAAGTAPDGGEAAPLVDPSVLQDLGAGLDDPAAAGDFAKNYIKIWDQRRQSLATALERGDEAASLDAVLSVKISSAMVGGIRLSRIAGEVEDAIRDGDMARARSLLPEVEEHGRKTTDELQAGQGLPET